MQQRGAKFGRRRLLGHGFKDSFHSFSSWIVSDASKDIEGQFMSGVDWDA
jgi:hypothetical protein